MLLLELCYQPPRPVSVIAEHDVRGGMVVVGEKVLEVDHLRARNMTRAKISEIGISSYARIAGALPKVVGEVGAEDGCARLRRGYGGQGGEGWEKKCGEAEGEEEFFHANTNSWMSVMPQS